MTSASQSSPSAPVVTGNTPFTKPENRAFYPALDGIRAIAFLMVFGQHYLQIPWGWAGVDLFFVLSGFLITGILFDTRNDAHRVRNFYIRRTLRIMPLYYAILLALLALQPILHWQWNWRWTVWPLYAGNFARFFHPYVEGDALQRLADFQPSGYLGHTHVVLLLGHFWSLCVEEQFYFIWPWIVFWIRDRRKLMWICAATLPICLGMRLAAQHQLPAWLLQNELLYRATPFRLDALLTGSLFALLLRGPYREVIPRIVTKLLPLFLFFSLLWTFIVPYAHLWHRPYEYPPWKFTWGLAAIDILSVLLVVAALPPASLVYRIFSVRLLRWMGRISYGAYVLHDIPHILYLHVARYLVHVTEVHRGVSEKSMQVQVTALTAIIGLASTFFLAWLSFRFLESFFLNFKEKWTVRGVPQAANSPALAAEGT